MDNNIVSDVCVSDVGLKIINDSIILELDVWALKIFEKDGVATCVVKSPHGLEKCVNSHDKSDLNKVIDYCLKLIKRYKKETGT
jgi:hypothetical protein